jgi:LacI family transcriptional regulator
VRSTAIIGGTDQLAFGVMIEAPARGLHVPDDLSVISFNDADDAAFLSPSLTTVRVHAAEIGRAAGEHLIARMAGQPRVRGHPDRRRTRPARQYAAAPVQFGMKGAGAH